MKRILVIVLSASLIISGCGTMSNTGKGTIIGAGSGAALGAAVGAIAGKGKGAAIGAAVGAAVGAGTGAIIGNRMDKQRAELEKIEGASVDTLTDINGLKALKVTFAEGILFETSKSELSNSSRVALDKFAQSLLDNPDTDVVVYGHTDNTGSRELNQRLSDQRAMSVKNYLITKGIELNRLTTHGMAYDEPVADNSTAAGRAQNRRVEVYISANEQMIKKAETGNL
jgi:outer membrane protein OmpA-like peptidoglycan-associated protein